MKLPALLLPALLLATPALAQPLDFAAAPGSAPTPIQITASSGITWSQDALTVTASGNAKAVRGNVTVLADALVAHYRKAPGAAANSAGSSPLSGGQATLYELDAIGHVHIYTPTDNAWGDKAVYSLDNAVLVLTGSALKLTTPQDVVTARDSIEYYSVKRMAVARGNALIAGTDGRSLAADVITGYLSAPTQQPSTPAPTPASPDALAQAGSLQRVEAVGHVVVHTATDTATGDTGAYLPPVGLARLGGNVHVLQGPNALSGSDVLLNTKTGQATLFAGPGGQVSGIILPVTGKGTAP